jgi:hypothetical protein
VFAQPKPAGRVSEVLGLEKPEALFADLDLNSPSSRRTRPGFRSPTVPGSEERLYSRK